jgi:hypothetical protein
LNNPTFNTMYQVSGYIVDKDGGVSPTYSVSVTVVDTPLVVVNHGTGELRLSWSGGSANLASNQYYSFSSPVSNLTATMKSSGAAYQIETNGNLARVDADPGVVGVQLSVHTTTCSTWGTTPASGSSLVGMVAFTGTGNVGDIMLPGGNAMLGSSTLNVTLRGNLGSITGPSGSGKLWTEAMLLSFQDLNGSITGLDKIMSLSARGRVGDSLADHVWVNDGIGFLTASEVAAQVLGSLNNYNLNDLPTIVEIGHGGVSGSLDLGRVTSFSALGAVNSFKALALGGPFLVPVAADILQLVFGLQIQEQLPALPEIKAEEGVINQILILPPKATEAKVAKIEAKSIEGLTVKGSLTVTGPGNKDGVISVDDQINFLGVEKARRIPG